MPPGFQHYFKMLVTWRYRLRNGLMEKFDPRARWIFSLAFLFAVTLFWDTRFLAFFFIIAFAWYFSSRAKWKETRRGWYLIGFILFMMIVINTIITGGGAGGVVPPGGHLVWLTSGRHDPFDWLAIPLRFDLGAPLVCHLPAPADWCHFSHLPDHSIHYEHVSMG